MDDLPQEILLLKPVEPLLPGQGSHGFPVSFAFDNDSFELLEVSFRNAEGEIVPAWAGRRHPVVAHDHRDAAKFHRLEQANRTNASTPRTDDEPRRRADFRVALLKLFGSFVSRPVIILGRFLNDHVSAIECASEQLLPYRMRITPEKGEQEQTLGADCACFGEIRIALVRVDEAEAVTPTRRIVPSIQVSVDAGKYMNRIVELREEKALMWLPCGKRVMSDEPIACVGVRIDEQD